MALAANLANASSLSYQQVGIRWKGLILKSQFTGFINACEPIFPDVEKADTVGNWLIPMRALALAMPDDGLGQTISYVMLDSAADYTARICLAALWSSGAGLISLPQVNALLAAWNTWIGTP